jgi:hypothetical protein
VHVKCIRRERAKKKRAGRSSGGGIRSPFKKYKMDEVFEMLIDRAEVFYPTHVPIPKDGLVKLPARFCLAENPEDSFRFLRMLIDLLKSDVEAIKIDFMDCSEMNLDASTCMDMILKHYFEYCKRDRTFPMKRIWTVNVVNESIRKFLYSTGTHKILNLSDLSYPDVKSYDLVRRRKGVAIGQKDVDTTTLANYVDSCLGVMKQSLSPEAKSDLGIIIGEVIINAEEHSSLPYRYSIGYFRDIAQSEKDKHYGSFQFVIFNFGQSMYERLRDPVACQNPEIILKMKRLSEQFINKGWLGRGAPEFTEETLWTLFSLQDGVSIIDKTRGNGTIRFIESFLKLGGETALKRSKLTLFSGSTRVVFDGTYSTRIKLNEKGQSHSVITFNLSGTLEDKPDKNFVTSTPYFFPGTMIYVDLCITEAILQQDNESGNNQS